MKRLIAVSASWLAMLFLAGCATTGGGSGGGTALIATAPMGTVDVALEQPETVWVPARYRNDERNALFIDGRAYVAPGGFNDMAGFLPMASGYLVAVYQPTVSATSGDENEHAFLVFYSVDDNGETRERVGVIPNVINAVVGQHAIYGQREAGGGNYSFVGYNTSGEQVTGPQGVMSATPAPNGGWYLVREAPGAMNTSSDYRQKLAFYKLSPSGQMRLVGQFEWKTKSYNNLLHSRAIFVNRPPVADTVRTGQWLRMVRDYSIYTGSGDYMYRLGVYDMTRGGQYYKLGPMGMNRNMTHGQAVSLALRTLVTEVNGQPVFGLQLAKSSGLFQQLNWGLMTYMGNTTESVPIFPIYNGGINTLRALVAENSNAMSLNDQSDVYNIITPTTTIVVEAGKNMLRDGHRAVYDLTQKAKLPEQPVQQFLLQYGVAL